MLLGDSGKGRCLIGEVFNLPIRKCEDVWLCVFSVVGVYSSFLKE